MRFRSGGLWYEHSILLAPPLATLIAPFRSVHEDHVQHDWLLAEAQRLRARVYLEDGAIERAQVSASGRFVHPLDRDSWHLLTLNSDGEVSGCLRYSQMDLVSFYRLEVARSALARSREWGMRLRHAVERKRADARFRGVAYAELGGWALTEQTRGSREALRMTLTVYALTQFLGGAVGTTTATKRHHSSTILRKLGGTPLVSDGMELPAYYDPQYKCEMEILAFDSDCPNPKYRSCIDDYRQDIANLAVICAEPCSDTSRVEYRRPIGVPANGVSLSPVLN